MSAYNPPIENVPIFDSLLFSENNDATLTIVEADKRYLKYPVAQGNETLQGATIQGALVANGTSTFNNNATFNATADIIQESGSEILQKPATTLVSSSGANIMNRTILATNAGATTTPPFEIYNSSYGLFFIPNTIAGTYDPIVRANDNTIVSTAPLTLTNQSSTSTNGIRISNSSALIGYGGSSATPTTSLECNGTSVVVNPSLTFPDNRVQNSAFTGAGALAGSYTLSNITIDSNGKITAISNGSAGTPFVPKYHTFANYQSGTSGYSQGAYINWSSGWGAFDYVIIRVRAQVNWGNSGSGWQNYATTAGELIIRPFFAPAGVIGSLSSPNIFWSTNSGSVVGNVGKLIYYTGAVNNGSQGYFFVYGSGGSGGGSSGYIQLMCDAPGASGGWEYTCSYEYMLHSTSGGSITFSNGSGTNNSLP